MRLRKYACACDQKIEVCYSDLSPVQILFVITQILPFILLIQVEQILLNRSPETRNVLLQATCSCDLNSGHQNLETSKIQTLQCPILEW